MSQSNDAIIWVKKNKKLILERFTDLKKFPKEENPLTIFMAGSPGAGKTETARSWVKNIATPIVHIDADAVRSLIPGYDGKNASLFQRAATIGVEKLFDHIIEHHQSVILDTTFTPYEKAKKNVVRALQKERSILIIYVYQDPLQAWNFAKAREIVEGRVVPKESFIRQFLEAPKCVQSIIDEFDSAVQIDVVRKDIQKGSQQQYFERISKVDDVVSAAYTRDNLERIIF
ncbi:zeta toxin family protein [Candidatus Peregrinibacteria bacterium]|nr:zeta toxin family protein [Candidatus Peregrinibacteria bacterium]